MKKKIILVCGRTGFGKSSIIKRVCKNLGLKQVVSYTTRPMRDNEKTGSSDHYFIQPDEVKKYADDMAAYTEINGYEYFATKTELRSSDIYTVDPNGIADLKERCGDEFDFVTIYVRTPKALAIERCKSRGNEKEFMARYDAENQQFTDYEKKMPWEYHIFNIRTLDDAVATMTRMIRKELNL